MKALSPSRCLLLYINWWVLLTTIVCLFRPIFRFLKKIPQDFGGPRGQETNTYRYIVTYNEKGLRRSSHQSQENPNASKDSWTSCNTRHWNKLNRCHFAHTQQVPLDRWSCYSQRFSSPHKNQHQTAEQSPQNWHKQALKYRTKGIQD